MHAMIAVLVYSVFPDWPTYPPDITPLRGSEPLCQWQGRTKPPGYKHPVVL